MTKELFLSNISKISAGDLKREKERKRGDSLKEKNVDCHR
jgi:hypothetical protein